MMLDQPRIARRNAARLLMSPFAAFWVALPTMAAPDEDEQEKVTAARVAKKVETWNSVSSAWSICPTGST